MRFKNNLGFASVVDHTWDDKFGVTGAKIGDTLKLRDPVRYTVVKGRVATPESTTENYKTLTLDTQAHVAFSFTSAERSLSIDQFSERYLVSAAGALANVVDVDGLTKAYQSTGSYVGTPGTAFTSLDYAYAAGRKLDEASTPMDGQRYMVISPAQQEATLKSAATLFNNQAEVGNQYKKGRMGTMGGFQWIMDQNVRTHTVGPLGGSPIVSASAGSQTGSTLLVTGFTAAAASRMKAGDQFTLPLVYSVNPVSGDSTGSLQVFTVTSDVSSAADGSASLPIFPAITPTGVNKTVTASPAPSAPLTIIGTANSTSVQGIAFHKNAFVLGMAPLDVPPGTDGAKATDPDTGVSLRTETGYDILNDLWITRVDCLYGWAAPRAEWSVRVVS